MQKLYLMLKLLCHSRVRALACRQAPVEPGYGMAGIQLHINVIYLDARRRHSGMTKAGGANKNEANVFRVGLAGTTGSEIT